MTATLLTSLYLEWHVSIRCSQANAGFYRSVAMIRAPISFTVDRASSRSDRSTVLETPGNFYPTVVLSNAAALASARRFIENAEGRGKVH